MEYALTLTDFGQGKTPIVLPVSRCMPQNMSAPRCIMGQHSDPAQHSIATQHNLATDSQPYSAFEILQNCFHEDIEGVLNNYLQDKGLKQLFAEPENMSGILNWMLEGYRKFREEKLDMPDSVINATQEYRMASDKISQFCEACLVEKPGSELRSKAVYNRYKEWSVENGYRADGMQNFKKEFEKHYEIVRQRPKDGGEKTTLVLNVEFVVDSDEPPAELVPQ